MKPVPEGADYWDLGNESEVVLRCLATDEMGNVREERLTLPIPEETLDLLEKLIGDGNASITVGAEMKTSEDFRSAGSTCYIKLTCGQTLPEILEARELATELAGGFARHGYQHARYLLDDLCGVDTAPPPPLEISKEEEVPKPKKEGPEPGRHQKRGRVTGRNKPSWRK